MKAPILSLELCRPEEDHAKLIYSWRTDETTVKSFFRSGPPTWEEFSQDYQLNYFRDPSLPPLFIRDENARVAYIGLQRIEHPTSPRRKCCSISINVAPEARGKGIAAQALELVSDFIAATGFDDILAEVKTENIASIKSFETAGYSLLPNGTKELPNGNRIEIRRFLKNLSSTGFLSKGVYIIAEAGSNWRMGTPARDMAMGQALIDAAKKAGADAVKFQTYRAESVYVENAGKSNYLADAGIETDIREIFKDLEMPYELVEKLAAYAKKVGIDFMSTPFSPADFAAIDPHVTAHKIASYEITYPELIELAAASKKPLIMSTGAATEEEIRWAVNHFRAHGGRELCILQCTAKYPAPLSAMNLQVIPWLASTFGVAAGFSDHSRHHLYAPMAAAALGAKVIEKHFTLHNSLPGPDHPFAITAEELAEMVKGIRAVETSLGDGKKRVLAEEEELAAFAKRGIQAIRMIRQGEKFYLGQNVGVLRPGKQKIGAHPKLLPKLEGKVAKRNISLGEGVHPADWE